MSNRQMIPDVLRPLWYIFIFAAVSFITFLVLISTLIVVQGQRNEVRSAGAAVVVLPSHVPESSQEAIEVRLDHAVDLYRRGYVNRIIVAEREMQTKANVEEYLVERRLPPEALLFVQEGDRPIEQLRSVGEVMRLNGIESVLVSSERYEMLRILKMSRDVGMDAHGVPIRPAETSWFEDALQIVGEAWSYITYIFFG
ncbi:MAG: YdcF family protein [Chloroflexota bacterium]